MNYARLPDMLPDLNAYGVTGEDARVTGALEEASQAFQTMTSGRRIHSELETFHFSGDGCSKLWVGDLLSITTIKVADTNFQPTTYENTLASGTDYTLWPRDAAAKGKPYRAVILNPDGQYSAFPIGVDNVEIVGKFGYSEIRQRVVGNAAVTGTIADTTGLTITITEPEELAAGDTFFLDDEEMGPIVAVTGTGVIVRERGINGTTAATHSNDQVYLRRYPADVERAVRADAARYLWRSSQGMPEGGFREMWPAISSCVQSYVDPAGVI